MQIERLGPYQIVGKLGRGGMGTVYEAVNLESGEPAAVKLLSAALAQEEGFRERFEAEIETLRKLNHPNIVRLFGFGEQDDQLFYAMELIDGNSLEEELGRGRRFDWREVVRIVLEICRALRHAHDRGVIHRDIKPGNLLLSTNGQVKLSDFGIARLFGNTRLTSAGSVLGTAEYMAPEQAAGKPVDQRSDLYSLGAVMYVLLARKPVFKGKSLGEILYKQQFETPEPLRKHNTDVPEELERIILQLLDKDPARRLSNAMILGRCLEAMQHAMHVPGLTVQADPSYYEAPPSPADTVAKNGSAADSGISLIEKDSVLPDTQVFAGPQPSVELAYPKSPSDLGRTSSAAPPPPENNTNADSPPVTTGHFVPVSKEELGKEDVEEEKTSIISLQTWALVAGLILVGLTIWYFLQPPNADALYKRIGEHATGEASDSLIEDEDHIRSFLDLYPNDPRAEKLRKLLREIDLYSLQRKFDHDLEGFKKLENPRPIELAYLDASDYTRYSPEQQIVRLQALIDLYKQSAETETKISECLTLAQRRLDKLKQEVRKYAPEQLEVLQKRLDEADSLAASDPKRAQNMYRAAIELYGDKPWAADAVSRARTALDKLNNQP
jgi:eukaryotic-like serine/threonine-protein kinase